MKQSLKNLYNKYFIHKAVVLMYHRIAEPIADVWGIAVSSEKFEQHLKILKAGGNVVPLGQVVIELNNGKLTKNHIAITFDDGYKDNFITAKPLLEKYELPATFFISSGNIDSDKEFWWDELEYMILFAKFLPSSFFMTIAEQTINADLSTEEFLNDDLKTRHTMWDACIAEPPTKRASLFYLLWKIIKLLTAIQQQECLANIRTWATLPIAERAEYRSISVSELEKFSFNDLFTIGAHTITHPALATHDAAYQRKELVENKNFLANTIGRPVTVLAYPYGNYDEETINVAADLGFSAAFTTEEITIKSDSHQYSLGRFQVKNVDGNIFKDSLKKWMTQ